MFFLSVCFVTIAVTITSCKQRQTSSPEEAFEKTVLGEKEYERVNGALELQLITGMPENYRQFQNGKLQDFPLDFATYKTLWTQYQKFIFVDKDKQSRKKQFRVRLYLTKREGKPAHVSKTTPLKPIGPEASSYKKTCDVAANQDSYAITYVLLGLRQPNLVRNFLILAKAGFFDGRDIDYFGSFPSLVYFGQDQQAPNGFYFPTDDWYSEKTPDFDDKKFKNDEDEDLRDKSAASYDNAWQKMQNTLAYGSLIGFSENLTDFDETREVLPGKIGISLVTSGTEEIASFKDRKTFPVIFGRLERTRNKPLDLKSVIQGLSATGQAKAFKYIINCVEIFEPEVVPFLDAEEEIPLPE